jgi:hypothetical protein
MRLLTCCLLLLLAVPARASVSPFPCNNEFRAQEDAYGAYDRAGKDADVEFGKVKAALARVEALEKALKASTAALHSAEVALHTAAGKLAACIKREPAGGCGAQERALQGARARADRAATQNMKAFEAWTKALSDRAAALERLGAENEKVKAAYQKFEEASKALDECEAKAAAQVPVTPQQKAQ